MGGHQLACNTPTKIIMHSNITSATYFCHQDPNGFKNMMPLSKADVDKEYD
jgi:hypothetical protein